MAIVTFFLIITTAWIIYHFVVAYRAEQSDLAKNLRKLSYGKSMGLFTMITGFLGQMIGLANMFDAIESATSLGEAIKPHLVFGGVKVTMIVSIYGILIYLFTLLLWLVTSTLIEKKHEKQVEV